MVQAMGSEIRSGANRQLGRVDEFGKQFSDDLNHFLASRP